MFALVPVAPAWTTVGSALTVIADAKRLVAPTLSTSMYAVLPEAPIDPAPKTAVSFVDELNVVVAFEPI